MPQYSDEAYDVAYDTALADVKEEMQRKEESLRAEMKAQQEKAQAERDHLLAKLKASLSGGMRVTNKLIWCSTVMQQVWSGAATGDKAGEVSCRIRTYCHKDDEDPTEEDAIKERTVTLADPELTDDIRKRVLEKLVAKGEQPVE